MKRKIVIFILVLSFVLSNVNVLLAKEFWNVSLVKTKPEGNISTSDGIAIFNDGAYIPQV